jgi:peptide chain release factor subunit 1
VTEPPQPLTQTVYRCDRHFYVEPLLALFESSRALAVLYLGGDEAVATRICGTQQRRLFALKTHRRGNTRRGGQSAERFQRQREQHALQFHKGVRAALAETCGPQSGIEGLLLCGRGPTLQSFQLPASCAGLLLDRIAVDDRPCVTDLYARYGLRLGLAPLLKQARALVTLAQRGSGLVVYGREELRRAIQQGALKRLVIVRKKGCGLPLNDARAKGCDVCVCGPMAALETLFAGALGERWY